jgi:hypothetical protein
LRRLVNAVTHPTPGFTAPPAPAREPCCTLATDRRTFSGTRAEELS